MSRTETVILDNPIARGEQTIAEIVVRKPDSGSLRGTSLNDLLTMDVNALIIVLPRITSPALTAIELRRMEPEDLLQLGQVVSGFLLPKSVRVEASRDE
ncbi:phage tail assembly protein [Pseudomonas sp. AN-1]|uniref:phage tail assembly protein n=1 Tax=Pseudomonas sp. AN-1 TaxID=3096605 RepID=UPI002A6ADFD2|nr:phage tail assembly protein [Pseudomonas sp. AN-1]WPP47696.1 phage tail assembly protein [Pseudomonas sp. AN-1]